jgi:hypothetical protein
MPYTRAELLSAYRKDFPGLDKVSDNDLFSAIAQDSPELAKGAAEYQQQQGPAPDERTAGQVAIDQTGHVLKGLASTITGIPGTIKEVANIGRDALSGNVAGAVERTGNVASGLAHQVADPFTPIIRTGVEAVAPGSTGGPATQQEWEKAAEAAGGGAAGHDAVGGPLCACWAGTSSGRL